MISRSSEYLSINSFLSSSPEEICIMSSTSPFSDHPKTTSNAVCLLNPLFLTLYLVYPNVPSTVTFFGTHLTLSVQCSLNPQYLFPKPPTPACPHASWCCTVAQHHYATLLTQQQYTIIAIFHQYWLIIPSFLHNEGSLLNLSKPVEDVIDVVFLFIEFKAKLTLK